MAPPESGSTITVPQSRATVSVHLRIALTLAACALAAWSIASTIVVFAIAFTKLPIYDAWDYWVPRVVALRAQRPFLWLVSQHSEHRVATSRVLYLIDHHAFSFRGEFLVICSAFLFIAIAAFLIRYSRKIGVDDMPFYGAIVCSFFFSAQQFVNYIWPAQVCLPLVLFFAVTAILCSARVESLRGVCGLWLLAILGSYSMAQGLFVWPVVISVLLMRRLRKEAIATVIVGAITWVSYFLTYFQPPGGASVTAGLGHLPKVVLFFVAYLGSPLAEASGIGAQEMGQSGDYFRLAVCAVGGIMLLVATVWLVRHARTKWDYGAIGVICYTILCAGGGGLGRSNLPIAAAVTDRYQTSVFIAWAALLALLLSRWNGLKMKLATVVFTAIFVSSAQMSKISYAENYRQVIESGEMSLINGVYRNDLADAVYHTPEVFPQVVPMLRAQGLTVWADYWTHWVGTPASDHYIIGTPGYCRIESVTKDPFGWRSVGWCYDRRPMLVLVDDAGLVDGFARSVISRPDLYKADFSTDPYCGWITYTRKKPVRFYQIEGVVIHPFQ